MELISINPGDLEVGLPITVTLNSESDGAPLPLRLTNPKGEEILIAFNKDLGTQWTSQFALYEEGKYELSYGTSTSSMVVHRKRDLDFSTEFWALGVSTVLLLGGLIAWSRNRKKAGAGAGAGASSPCGPY